MCGREGLKKSVVTVEEAGMTRLQGLLVCVLRGVEDTQVIAIYLHIFDSSGREVACVHKKMVVVLHKRKHSIAHATSGLQQHRASTTLHTTRPGGRGGASDTDP